MYLWNVKRLTNHEYTHRLRVGDWRILFNIFEEISMALPLRRWLRPWEYHRRNLRFDAILSALPNSGI